MVLDSRAWMALVMGEAAGVEVQTLIHAAAKTSRDLWMTTVNLGEVWYSVARRKSPASADEALELVSLAHVKIVPADWKLTKQPRGSNPAIGFPTPMRSRPRWRSSKE